MSGIEVTGDTMIHNSACCGLRQASMTRRSLLKVGGLGLLGLTLPNLLRAWEQGGSRTPKAKSVVSLHQFGGPSQFETFDMKPDAAEGVRGIFKPAATKVSGISVCEQLPRMAAVM